jgi:hypothetical protein
MGWLSDFVSDPIGTTVDTVSNAVDTVSNAVTNHPLETAAAATAAYFSGGTSLAVEAGSAEALAAAESGTAATATAANGAEALSGIDLGGVGASPATWTGATVSQTAASQWTWGQAAAATSTGLNLATSGIKLAALGKTKMNSSLPTVDGLTGGLAPTPIQTPSGLITTTPQGPVTAGPVAASGGFMGMDTQTLIVIAVAMGGIWYLMKHGK